MFSIATRELATRQVQETLLPAIITGEEAQPKARELSQQFRRNFDSKVQRLLQPAGYRNAENVMRRVVDGEINDMRNNIRTLDDVVEHELTRAVFEVAEAEVAERLQTTLSAVAGLNQTSAERDLSEIMRRADADGNEVITFDELYELMTGQPIDSQLAPFVRDWVVLKSPRLAESRWERWGSLWLAPQLKRASRLAAISRKMWDRSTTQLEARASELATEVTESAWRLDSLLEDALRVASPRTREQPEPPSLARASQQDAREAHGEHTELVHDADAERDAAPSWRRPWRWLRRRPR